jgi:hypothetical protein
MAVKVFKINPQGFNSPAGFDFVLWLDDASRNGLLCSTQASMNSASRIIAGDAAGAESLVHIAQSCQDASTLLYTVSESSSALYTRYLRAGQSMMRQAMETITKCNEALKQAHSK